MSRATSFYFLTILLLILGLWAVVRYGGRLSAPQDLSGNYELEGQSPGRSMRIQQSGRFVRVNFDGGPLLDLHWQGEEISPGIVITKLAAAKWKLAIEWSQSRESQGASPGRSAIRGIVLDGPGYAGVHAAVRAPKAETPAPRGSQPTAHAPEGEGVLQNPILLLISQIALILGLSRVMGILFARLRQPQVMGEMVAGIMLGPSLFGLLLPGLSATLFPAASIGNLNILSQIGVIFFLFLIGLELDPKLLKDRGHAAVVISHVSIIAPFLLGAGLSLYLYTALFNSSMRFVAVALFMGASMSITAFPVLARILTERNLHKTKVGAITITCAAVDDVTAWCMLAFVVAIARATMQGSPGHGSLFPAMMTAIKAVLYVLAMFFLVRPFLRRLQLTYDRQGFLSQNIVAIIFLLVLASAYTTEAIGIHALFGAFLMGAIMPKGTSFIRTLSEKLEDYTVVFLLPLFFAYTGLKTQIGLLNSPTLWFDTFLIIFIACLGKFGGSTLAARACGLPLRESSAIGILMNTRGLMELVILNIGRELGVITDAVFAMMVIMALATTGLTTPVLHWVYPRRLFGDALEPPVTVKRRGFSVLIPVADPRSGGPLLHVADLLTGPKTEDRKIYALHLRRPVDHEAYRSGLPDPTAGVDISLRPLLDHAERHHIPVEVISYVSRDVAADIARTAEDRQANLVLIGFHKPVFSKTILGGTVHHVLTETETNVGIFVDRGFRSAQRVLVPFLGGIHDRLALELAGRLGRNAGAHVTVLHVVPHDRRGTAKLDARGAVNRAFNDPSQPNAVEFKLVEHASPVDAVLEQAADFDLVVIGVSEEWGLESQLFGWKPERIAQGCLSSLLIVRKGGAPRSRESATPARAKEPAPAA